jgi:hypothetical protein
LLWFCGLALLVGCGDFGEDPADDGNGGPMEPPAATVSFAEDVEPIFGASCVDCHGDGANAGLDLRSGLAHANLVNVPASESALDRVEPGEPGQSWLYLKLTGQQNVGDAMPPGGSLPADALELIRTWIEEGALDN